MFGQSEFNIYNNVEFAASKYVDMNNRVSLNADFLSDLLETTLITNSLLVDSVAVVEPRIILKSWN